MEHIRVGFKKVESAMKLSVIAARSFMYEFIPGISYSIRD